MFQGTTEFKVRNSVDIVNGAFYYLYAFALGWRYISSGYTVLINPKKDEIAVHCCDPALAVLVMFVSRNVLI